MISGLVFLPEMRLMFQLRRAFVSLSFPRLIARDILATEGLNHKDTKAQSNIVPEGQPKIARRFNAGFRGAANKSRRDG
jgi:hypothetical protein